MLCNITLCKACLNRLVGRNKFVRFKSHYAVLGVTQKATQKEIRDAYIKLSKQMHPDQNRQDSKSHDKFVQINEAYEVLGKDSSRRDYDEKLRFQYPKPTANPYKASRPSNYYSSGQFYETPYHRSGFDPSNPYARRPGTGFDSDPFSDTNYDHSFYQRKREEKATFTAGFSMEAEPPTKNDPTLKTFNRIFWLMAFGMVLFLIKELVYGVYLDYVTHKLKEDLERRKKVEEHRNAEKIVRSIYPTPGKS